jgi:hypothetical protein
MVHAFSLFPYWSSWHNLPTRQEGRRRRSASPCSSRNTPLLDTFYNDFEGFDNNDNDDEEEEEEEEEDDFLLVDHRDWRTFRKNLVSLQKENKDTSTNKLNHKLKSVSKENEEILQSQSPTLFQEYQQGVWAHEVSTVRCIHTNIE